jgi:curved DNA-binding protein CbpA
VNKAEIPDHYEVLQVSRNAQPLILTKAYRLLAAFYHPDNRETGDAEAFGSVVEAYRVLSDPVRRGAYDGEKFGTLFTPSTNGTASVDEVVPQGRTDSEQELLAAPGARHPPVDPSPELPLMVIPDLFGCSIDEAQFTLWYLRGKKFIEMTDDGMVITVAGVDFVEGNDISGERQVPDPPALVSRPFMLDEGN